MCVCVYQCVCFPLDEGPVEGRGAAVMRAKTTRRRRLFVEHHNNNNYSCTYDVALSRICQ